MQSASVYCFAKSVTLYAELISDFRWTQSSVELFLGLFEDRRREDGRSA